MSVEPSGIWHVAAKIVREQQVYLQLIVSKSQPLIKLWPQKNTYQESFLRRPINPAIGWFAVLAVSRRFLVSMKLSNFSSPLHA